MPHVLIVGDDSNTREALAALRSGPAITVPLGTPLSVAARELILRTLEHCGGERKRTAEMLGICTKTLYNRLREYGINTRQAARAEQIASDIAGRANVSGTLDSQPG